MSRKSQRPSDCHPERRNWAKGYCKPCYGKARREGILRPKKPNTCGHPDKPTKAKGMCASCYMIRRRAKEGAKTQLRTNYICGHHDRKHMARGRCQKCYQKWMTENVPEYKDAQKRARDEWKKRNKDRVREYAQKPRAKRVTKSSNLRRYKITFEQYVEMRSRQNNTCAICNGPGGKNGLGIDHCHASGVVRGLLCSKCNAGIGMLGEDLERMSAAIEYVARHKHLGEQRGFAN